MNILKEWRNQYKNEKRVKDNIITLSGVVGDDWWSEGFNAKTIRNLAQGIEGDITIRLNSPGGSAFDGIEIYNELKAMPNKITVEVTALAASAATFICMAADEVLMCTGSQMMIHNAWTYTAGNAEELLQVVDDLEKIDSSIKEIYAERTGLDLDTITEYMAKEEMWTADQAIEKGFAQGKRDSVVTEKSQNLIEVDAIDAYIQKAVAQSLAEHKQVVEEVKPQSNKNTIQKLFGGK